MHEPLDRQNISSGTTWEERVGYSRAVRVGPFVSVTGTIAVNEDGDLIAPGDARTQTSAAIAKIERALNEAGATLADVVRTRMFVTDLDEWEGVADAHRAAFGDVRPCATMIGVDRLFANALVEIEADAIIRSGGSSR